MINFQKSPQSIDGSLAIYFEGLPQNIFLIINGEDPVELQCGKTHHYILNPGSHQLVIYQPWGWPISSKVAWQKASLLFSIKENHKTKIYCKYKRPFCAELSSGLIVFAFYALGTLNNHLSHISFLQELLILSCIYLLSVYIRFLLEAKFWPSIHIGFTSENEFGTVDSM